MRSVCGQYIHDINRRILLRGLSAARRELRYHRERGHPEFCPTYADRIRSYLARLAASDLGDHMGDHAV